MTTEQALGEFLVAQKVAKKGDSREDWYSGHWFYTKRSWAGLCRSFPVSASGMVCPHTTRTTC